MGTISLMVDFSKKKILNIEFYGVWQLLHVHHENSLVSLLSDSGKIVRSNVWSKIKESGSLPSLRNLPTMTLACLSLVWPDLGLFVPNKGWNFSNIHVRW